MPDARIADEFARFADEFTGSFRPVPVESMPRWRRHKRRAALWMGGLAAALVAALSLNALQPGAGGERPLWTDRAVHLEGAHGELNVQFADRWHGWALAGACRAGNICDYVLGRTTDGGRTWARVDLSRVPYQGRPVLAVRGPDRIIFGVTGPTDDLWESTDAGQTFHRPTGAAMDIFPALPPDTVTGADHTAWKIVREGLDSYASYSADGGATWRVLRPALGTGATLRLSPNGRDAWAFASNPTRVWRLERDAAYAEPDFPISVSPDGIGPLNGRGLLALVPGQGVGVWRGGHFAPLPRPLRDAEPSMVLPDGAIALVLDGTLIVGREEGDWIRYVRG
ncbi:WD40/YVTN/BNR-like repeat-containing protein [Dactylosporangium matsuzakiense]|uniref:BNR/Asp-box repeat protein n=1 Tax=Dactylosporangium matsuzakiense TaxID=53360 RepID=A0A9W6KKP9_9ACTN|nr:hypothetical protein [Dactylosporangium matsuzakiense]UWZ42655.1 hypothetical protein Dmats_34675 [Dactylosporangium matsuzakiense]GLL03872.1 hypothetical protein GCM10017581_056180 [Dactylosporangium matsuzakiense]